MKKCICIIMLAMCFSLSACGESNTSMDIDDERRVEDVDYDSEDEENKNYADDLIGYWYQEDNESKYDEYDSSIDGPVSYGRKFYCFDEDGTMAYDDMIIANWSLKGKSLKIELVDDQYQDNMNQKPEIIVKGRQKNKMKLVAVVEDGVKNKEYDFTLIKASDEQMEVLNTNRKVITDISNAQEIATSCNVAFADDYYPVGTKNVYEFPNGDAFPDSELNANFEWKVLLDDCGVCNIYLNGLEIYPDPKREDGYYTRFHKEIP